VRLTVIGCSPAWPNPGSAHSGYLVETTGGRLLLDCGPGVLERLRTRESWPSVDAVAISHFHLDHWGDLVPWIFGAAFGPGSETPRPCLWLPPGGAGTLRSFGQRLGFAERLEQVFDLHEYEDGVAFPVAAFEVTPFRLSHYDELTFGFRVADTRSTLAYSGDSAPDRNLAELARDADLFLCEATLAASEPGELRGHLTADEAVDAFRASGARRLVVIHRPAELPLDGGLERAVDGLEVEL